MADPRMPEEPGEAALKARVATLEKIIRDLHWMARRYSDGRQSYAVGLFNDNTRKLLALGVELSAAGDGLWARDAMGRRYDGLTETEAEAAARRALMEGAQDG